MKYHYIFLFLFPLNLLAQEITNVDFTANEQQKTITITYDLIAPRGNTFSVEIYCEDTRSQTEYMLQRGISGKNAYGEHVTPGSRKKIKWYVPNDLPQGLMSRIRFRIEATPEQNINTCSDYVETVNGVSFKMICIKGGTFMMGSNKYDREKPIHEVTLRNFYMAETEVTVAQYMAFVKATGQYAPEWMEEGNDYNITTGSEDYYKKIGDALTADNNPVVGVSWNDAKAYCKWLSETTGHTYTLPSEAQWEYAAGGGEKDRTKYAGSESIDEVAWYSSNSGSRTHTVKTKKPNQLGLYDMSGNVYEWCEDTWHDNYDNSPADGSPWVDDKSSSWVLRGGSWFDSSNNCRVADRNWDDPNYRDFDLGFRVIRSVP